MLYGLRNTVPSGSFEVVLTARALESPSSYLFLSVFPSFCRGQITSGLHFQLVIYRFQEKNVDRAVSTLAGRLFKVYYYVLEFMEFVCGRKSAQNKLSRLAQSCSRLSRTAKIVVVCSSCVPLTEVGVFLLFCVFAFLAKLFFAA